jgi:pimeloyl-ACP methyl ester carboxylesterase
MADAHVNGIRLFWEQHGDSGAPLVMVHGSWGDHHNWDAVVPELADSFRVMTYDRRGHSQSERPAGQGSLDEDVADLAELIGSNGLAPVHVIGNSGGAIVSLKLAAFRPELLASLVVHEPPLIGMIQDHPMIPAVRQRIGAVVALLRAGDMEAGARLFVDTIAFGPGMWDQLPAPIRDTFVFNAPTFLDEQNEPVGVNTVDLERLARFDRPILLTRGDQSAPFFGVIVDQLAEALPHARQHVFHGAGHVPHLTASGEYVKVVSGFLGAQRADDRTIRNP